MKKLNIVILIMLSFITTYAQKTDIGLFAGSSYYTGDLNPGKQFNQSSPAIGAFYRYNFTNRLAIKAGYTTTRLKSNDFQKRGLSFNTKLNEVSAQFEVNFYDFNIDQEEGRLSPYFFAGIGNGSFKAKKDSLGAITDQKRKNVTTFPFGVGIKYNPIENVSVGLEWGLRKTTGTDADMIDAVYDTGVRVSSANDWYAFAGFFISIRLNFFQSDHCEEITGH